MYISLCYVTIYGQEERVSKYRRVGKFWGGEGEGIKYEIAVS